MLAADRRGQQGLATAGAFLRVGYVDALSYPLSFLMIQIVPLANITMFFFVSKLIKSDTGLVGEDYFVFAVLGTLVLRMLSAGMEGLGNFVQRTIDQGQMELYLTQPVRWSVLPFAWFQWVAVERAIGSVIVYAAALMMGMRLDYRGALPALGIVLLGSIATLGIGILACSVRLLSKRVDPINTFYMIGMTVLSGVLFPVKLLPGILQPVSYLLPHTYTIDAVRVLLMPGNHDDLARFSPGQAAIGLTIYILVIFPIAMWSFKRSIQFARRHGLIGSY